MVFELARREDSAGEVRLESFFGFRQYIEAVGDAVVHQIVDQEVADSMRVVPVVQCARTAKRSMYSQPLVSQRCEPCARLKVAENSRQ